jgi:hypothetical protein
MAERIVIPLYGPRGLRYAGTESELRLIVDRLGVHVAEPTQLIPTRPEQPLQPTPEEQTQAEPTAPTPISRPIRIKRKEALCFADFNLRRAEPTVITFQASHFSPIEHEGLIIVIEAAQFLPNETFEIVQEQAESLDITVLPIYVRGIK